MENLPKWVLMWVKEFKSQLAELKKVVYQRVGGAEASVFWDEIDILTKRSLTGEKEPVQSKMVLMRYPAYRKELELLEAMLRRAQTFLSEKDIYGSSTQAKTSYYHVTKMLELVRQAQDVLRRHERLVGKQLSTDLEAGEQRTMQALERWLRAFDGRREMVQNQLESTLEEYEDKKWEPYLRRQARRPTRAASTIAALVIGLASALTPQAAYAGPPEGKPAEKEEEKPVEGSKEFYETFDDAEKLQEYLAPLERRYNLVEGLIGRMKERIPDEEEDEHETLQKRLAALQKLGQSLSRGYVRLGDLHYEESKDAPILEEDSRKAIRFDPNNWEAHQNLGAAHFFQKNYQGTVECCTRAIELDESNSAPHNTRGRALYFLKEYEQSLSDLKKAKELNPDTPHIDSWIRGASNKIAASR